MTEPVQQQIGYDLAGNPMYAPPVQYGAAPVAQQATQPLQPIKAHPWGAYIAGGCLGVLALTVLAIAIAFVVFGFAILAAVLALAVVALTICILVLRSMWTDYRKGR
ncbi:MULTISPECIES: hypothetical protein [Streptomyces]|uniref:Uncharacterized protein n=1 Tax=Streptomyces dengpaensis TaxID=2049881 RepID=A0ABN5I4E2_9ACTN|nr:MULTISPECIES: hypothetical protein [Streptomyces]AVH57873.1 hypothetical protein C4B68_21260 [Streptomyces dengpaensis]PIB03947.1 hypothetical protein B1C81_35465 [Streptomyces sp. HG99]